MGNYTLEEIYESMINGQWEQAVTQLKNSAYSLSDFINYLINDLRDCNDVVRFIRVYENNQ